MIDTEQETIIAGDSSVQWLIDRLDSLQKPIVIADHVCRVEVEGTAIARDITVLTTDQKAFVARLRPAETALLAAGQTYRALVTLTKAADDYRKTFVVMLHISAGDCC